MNSKQELGQFYTTNAKYIIGNLIKDIPNNANIIDPFAGNWDLLNYISDNKEVNDIIAFDLEPQNKKTKKRDTLINPPDYSGLYVITNPPYLAKNKTKNKDIFGLYNVGDLYKASIETIIGCEGGILIVPLNFLCDCRGIETRVKFLSQYKIQSLNIFEEQVFNDTAYTVCAFSFIKKENSKQVLRPRFYPVKKNGNNSESKYTIKASENYTMGGCFLNKIESQKSSIKIGRLTKDLKKGYYISNLYLYAIDSGSKDGIVRLEKKEEPYYGKETDRAFATIIFDKKIPVEWEEQIINEFNTILNYNRERYHSLFLTNFRNSTKEYARKRISFDLAFDIISYILKTRFGI